MTTIDTASQYDSRHAEGPQTAKPPPRGCFWAFGGTLILAGVLCTWLLTAAPLIDWAGSLIWWDKVDAQILRFAVDSGENGGGHGLRQQPTRTHLKISVHYKYTYENEAHESWTFAIGEPRFSYGRAMSTVEDYNDGDYRHAYVNPFDPTQSVLKRAYPVHWVWGEHRAHSSCGGTVYLRARPQTIPPGERSGEQCATRLSPHSRPGS